VRLDLEGRKITDYIIGQALACIKALQKLPSNPNLLVQLENLFELSLICLAGIALD